VRCETEHMCVCVCMYSVQIDVRTVLQYCSSTEVVQ
jgi:hypothetical protein